VEEVYDQDEEFRGFEKNGITILARKAFSGKALTRTEGGEDSR
jgi:hypothetical protein